MRDGCLYLVRIVRLLLANSRAQDRNLPFAQRVAKRLDVKAAQLQTEDDKELVFDLVGVDSSIANALRRVLLAEVCPGSMLLVKPCVKHVICIMIPGFPWFEEVAISLCGLTMERCHLTEGNRLHGPSVRLVFKIPSGVSRGEVAEAWPV